jgi:putative transposase
MDSIRTLRLKVKAEGYAWLNRAAVEVNVVWNFANATSHKAARPFAGPSKWLTAYDLDKLTAGATEYFEHIRSETIQRINAEFATRRKQSKKAKLRWRPSRGSRRALGWLPFKAAQLKRKGPLLGERRARILRGAWQQFILAAARAEPHLDRCRHARYAHGHRDRAAHIRR